MALAHGQNQDPLPAVETLDLLVVLGGSMNIDEETHYPWPNAEKRFIEQAIAAGRRVLGVCLGAQLVADVLGAKVLPIPTRRSAGFQSK